jgi:glutathione synthase/RimK-type ligase-like ATP-grasp enzyme
MFINRWGGLSTMRKNNRVGVIHAYPSAWLIHALREAGWHVVLIGDFTETACSSLGCEAVVGVPLWDEEALMQKVEAFHQKAPFDMLLPVYEGSTVLTARLSARLALPCYSAAAAIASRNKWIANQLWSQQDLLVPKTLPLIEMDRAWPLIEQHFKGDAVLKLSDSMNSQGVVRVQSQAMCEQAIAQFTTMLHRSRSVEHALDRNRYAYGRSGIQVLIQEYCHGPEFGVDVLLHHGHATALGVFGKADSSGPCFAETVSAWPTAHGAETEARIKSVAVRAALALGASVGCAHVEIRLTTNGPCVIEAGLRPGGAYTVRAAQLLMGVCQYQWLASALVGEPLPKVREPQGAALYGGVTYTQSGVLAGVRGVEVFEQVEGLVDVQVLNKEGDKVYALPSSAQPHFCYYLLHGQSRAQLLERHLRIQQCVQLDIQPEVFSS